nr:MAG TPA: hypothetical protein [Caudoviricetes sp.]
MLTAVLVRDDREGIVHIYHLKFRISFSNVNRTSHEKISC